MISATGFLAAPGRLGALAFARFKGHEDALPFPSGYMANLAVLTTLAGPGDLILQDKLNHASLIDAARASGATVRTYPHHDLVKLERLLERADPAALKIIVTDGVFSMDGDVCDLPALVSLCQGVRRGLGGR